jgi:hypothetical protein
MLHRDERVGGLGGPAPVSVACRGLGHALQLAEGVRAPQLVGGVEVGVIGRPGVVHGDAAKPPEDTGVVDAGSAALGVAGDQGVLVGAGAVHRVQFAGHPQPGLVKVRHLSVGQALF